MNIRKFENLELPDTWNSCSAETSFRIHIILNPWLSIIWNSKKSEILALKRPEFSLGIERSKNGFNDFRILRILNPWLSIIWNWKVWNCGTWRCAKPLTLSRYSANFTFSESSFCLKHFRLVSPAICNYSQLLSIAKKNEIWTLLT